MNRVLKISCATPNWRIFFKTPFFKGKILRSGELERGKFDFDHYLSLGALLHIYSPRYDKSDPGDLPERPEKSPTLWGPLTRTQVKIKKLIW